ncbi:GCG_CRPN prefix-to-repeats domain-containing protein [Brucella sp. MAB-22]
MSQPTNTHDAGSLAEQVGWRCGPGWHMNRYGRCVPNRARARCARGWHLNRNGVCVRNRPVHKVCARGYHLTPRGYCVRNW